MNYAGWLMENSTIGRHKMSEIQESIGSVLRIVSLFFCCIVTTHAFSQQPLPHFGPPLTIPLVLKGTYGEIRNGHFHSGIDLKTEGRIGLPVVAVADGYVSRIKADEYGFGRVIYMTHESGYVSVYGHLHKFCFPLDSLVTLKQQEQQAFKVEIFPAKGEFYFKKGDTLAWSGNSGGSGGPHLHFEIRNAVSEIPLNPMLFDFRLMDTLAPVLKRLTIYSVSDDFKRIDSIATLFPESVDGRHYFVKDTVMALNSVAIGFSAYDRAEDDSAILGLYGASLFCNGHEIYSYQMNNFSFDESKLVGGHIDYSAWQRGDTIIERCFMLPGDSFSQYGEIVNSGMVILDEKFTSEWTLNLKDVSGNEAVCHFTLRRAKEAPILRSRTDRKAGERTIPFSWKSKNQFKAKGIELNLPEHSLYRNIDFQFSKLPKSNGFLTEIFQVHSSEEALIKNATLSLTVSGLPEQLADKVVIVNIKGPGNFSAIPSVYRQGKITGSIASLGRYTVLADTIAPQFGKIVQGFDSIYGYSTLEVKVIEKLSGIKTYSCYVNQQWQLTEYDYKNEKLICYLRKISDKDLNVYFEATDKKGNRGVSAQNIHIKL